MIKFHEVIPNTEEWHEFRKTGIGASEAATVCGINEYDSAVRLFHEKVGTQKSTFMGNERTFWGSYMEPLILDMWQYWDGKDFITNYNLKNVVRTHKIPNGVYTNTDYPWLFYTPDAIINAGQLDLYGNPLDKDCPLECKCIDKLAYQNYGGLPRRYLYQIHHEMIVMDVQYAEFVYHVGGNEFKVQAIEMDMDIANEILEKTYLFWYKRVQAAKDQPIEIVQQLEPEPDGTESYTDFQKERFQKRNEKIMGTAEMYNRLVQREYLLGYISLLDEQATKIKNEVLQLHVHEGVYKIDWGIRGKSTKTSRHVISLKNKPKKELLIKNLLELKLW